MNPDIQYTGSVVAFGSGKVFYGVQTKTGGDTGLLTIQTTEAGDIPVVFGSPADAEKFLRLGETVPPLSFKPENPSVVLLDSGAALSSDPVYSVTFA